MKLIVSHVNGDFDALASLIAAGKLYPGSVVVLPGPTPPPRVKSFIDSYREQLYLDNSVQNDSVDDSVPELAVVVDTVKIDSLGPYAAMVRQAKEVHLYCNRSVSEEGPWTKTVSGEVGATATLLVEEIRRRSLELTELEATVLALGIYEKTGFLSFYETTLRDVNAISYLWEKGVQVGLLQEYLHAPLTAGQKELLESFLKSCEYYEVKDRRVLISSIAVDDYLQGLAILTKRLQEMEDVELVVTLVRMPGGILLSARSLVDDLDLRQLLSPLGVKGYPRAVSADLQGADYAETRDYLMDLLEKYIPPLASAEQFASFPVASIDSNTTVAEALAGIFKQGYGGYPVLEGGVLVGSISRQELLKAFRYDLGHAPVRGFMNREVVTVSPGDSITAVRRLMVEKNVGRLPVVDNDGKLVGIITRSDVLRALYQLDRRKTASEEQGPLLEPGEKISPTKVDNLLPLFKRALPRRLQSLLLLVGQRAARLSMEVYLVGGLIRDLLLGRPATKDMDFVIPGNALLLARDLQKYLGGKLVEYEQFGTATLFTAEGLRLDLVTAREEFYAASGALPSVEPAGLKKDLFRRDFTINTLACSLMPESFGQIYDFFDGRRDLEKRIIRALYTLSFIDDPLRILRAVRFEQRFGFTIEEDTLRLMRKAIGNRALEKVSRQRLNNEVSLLYREKSPALILQRLEELGALAYLYPRLSTGYQTWQRTRRVEETLEWFRKREWGKEVREELVYLCALAYDLSIQDRISLLRRLGFSREKRNLVLQACMEVPLILEELSGEGLRPSRLVALLEPLPVEALLLTYALAQNRQVKENVRVYLDSLQWVQPRLRGSDLKELGLEPGPLYQNVLRKLKEAVLDGLVRSPEEERTFVFNYLQQRGEMT